MDLKVSFLDYDVTAETAGIKGYRDLEDKFVQKRITELLTHPTLWQKTLHVSQVPTIRFTNVFPYNIVAADSGMHFLVDGGPICPSSSRCTVISGKDTNSVGKTEPYAVIYNGRKEVILREGSDVAIGIVNPY